MNLTLLEVEFIGGSISPSSGRIALKFLWATIKRRNLCISVFLPLSLTPLISPRRPVFLRFALRGNNNEFSGIASTNEHWDQRPFIRIVLPISPILLSILDTDVLIFVPLLLCCCLSLFFSYSAFISFVFSNVLKFLPNVFDVSKVVLTNFPEIES